MLITSQDYLDQDIVAEKQAARDYVVLVSTEFEIDGETYQVVLDGHHSLAAALADGVEPELEVASSQDHDAVNLIDNGEIDEFLEAVYHGSDYRCAITGKFVF